MMTLLAAAWLAVVPPAEDTAKAALDKTPRHAEYVDIPYAGGPAIKSFVVYPERKDKAPVVIVIHEIFGLSDWLRSVADRLAADGFIAVAPDMISGKGPDGGGTASVKSPDELRELIRGLPAEEVNARLNAVRSWALKLPAASDMTATVGFCWGGMQSFNYALEQPGLDAAVVFYGTNPAPERLRKLKVPVLGLYGGDDARVNTTVEPAASEAKKRAKTYEYEIYEGAGHGFLRQQSGREGANQRATDKSWPRVVEFLKRNLE
jgi:carboxymethylenebutenolidase